MTLIKRFFIKPFRWAIVYSVLLISCFGYVLSDTFIIPKNMIVVTEKAKISAPKAVSEQSEAVATDKSYEDDNIKLSIETIRKYDSTIYVADIQVSDISYLKTAFASNTYGRNIKAPTSEIAEENKAIFAINGDFYGFRNQGFVLRNGIAYRDSAREAGDDQALVIDEKGNFSVIEENKVALDSLSNIWQIMSFGPALLIDGDVVVDSNSEVSRAMNSNPRTAIGQISPLHYIVIVSDGRTNVSKGLSLFELANEFKEKGCEVAYNLDGGGSSTMYFNGKVINNPTDGRSVSEREVSDIVYFGY